MIQNGSQLHTPQIGVRSRMVSWPITRTTMGEKMMSCCRRFGEVEIIVYSFDKIWPDFLACKSTCLLCLYKGSR
jgi:hypothetical protein